MKCKQCDDDMEGLSVFDSPKTGYAYNLYQCDNCGMIAKDNVWDEAGVLWIPTEFKNHLYFHPKGKVRTMLLEFSFSGDQDG